MGMVTLIPTSVCNFPFWVHPATGISPVKHPTSRRPAARHHGRAVRTPAQREEQRGVNHLCSLVNEHSYGKMVENDQV
jgi:hypothetical protein